jgi:hypothetical protein
MRHRFLLFAALLIVFSYALAQGGSKRPGARAPAGPPPGGVPVGHAHNDIRYHLDQQTKHLEQLLKQDNSPATGVVPGSRPATQTGTPQAPHHLIGDPPLPGSVRDLSSLDTSSGVARRPGARPNLPATTRSAPRHLIGDPPTYPDDLGVLIGSAYFLSDDRAVLPGEVNLYSSDIGNRGIPGWPIYTQTVFNWNPTTGIGRYIYWQSGFLPDPSWVTYYYFAPTPAAPTPTPGPVTPSPITPTPILRYSTGASAPHIYLASGPVGTSTGLVSGQGVSGAFSPVGQSIVQMAPGSSYVAYYSGNENPGLAGGQITTASRFSAEDFTDDSCPSVSESGSSLRGLSVGLPDCSPSSGTIAEAIIGVGSGSSGRTFVEAPSATENLSESVQSQSYRALPGGYSEKTSQPVQEGAAPESGHLSIAQTNSGSTSQGSGSTLPWAVGGLLLGAGLLVGTRKVMTLSQGTPQEIGNPISEQVQRIYSGLASDIKMEKTREKYRLDIQAEEDAIEADVGWSQYHAQDEKNRADTIWELNGVLTRQEQKKQEDERPIEEAKQKLEQHKQKKRQDEEKEHEDELKLLLDEEKIQEDSLRLQQDKEAMRNIPDPYAAQEEQDNKMFQEYLAKGDAAAKALGELEKEYGDPFEGAGGHQIGMEACKLEDEWNEMDKIAGEYQAKADELRAEFESMRPELEEPYREQISEDEEQLRSDQRQAGIDEAPVDADQKELFKDNRDIRYDQIELNYLDRVQQPIVDLDQENIDETQQSILADEQGIQADQAAQVELADDIAQRQANLDDLKSHYEAFENSNDSDYSGGDHGLDDFVRNLMDQFDPDQYGLGGFDETASLPFIFPATDWDQSDETNAESEDSTPALGINEALEQAFEPITQLINSIGSPQDATQPTYPPGFSPADLGIPDYAQQLGDQQGSQADPNANPNSPPDISYGDDARGSMEDPLGDFGMFAAIFAAVSGLAGAALAAAYEALYSAYLWAGVTFYSMLQSLGSGWQRIWNFFSGGGAATNNVTASFEHATQIFNNGPLTNVGRALTKHPNIIGESGNIIQKLGGAAGVNEAGAKALQNIMQNGAMTTKMTEAFGRVIEYKLPSGLGARFNGTTGEFIGFLGRGL